MIFAISIILYSSLILFIPLNENILDFGLLECDTIILVSQMVIFTDLSNVQVESQLSSQLTKKEFDIKVRAR